MNRGNRPTQQSGVPAAAPVASAPSGSGNSGRSNKGLGGLLSLRTASVVLLFAGAVLVVALLWFVVRGGAVAEREHVDKSKMQAVFLNGGQVYFGNITDLNSSYLRLNDIYYLRVNQTVQPDQSAQQQSANDISLVKLGCELHGPQDEMLVNREQVVFWENLKGDGQVAKAVAEYKQQNPNGQNCETQTNTSTTPAPASGTTETGTGTQNQ